MVADEGVFAPLAKGTVCRIRVLLRQVDCQKLFRRVGCTADEGHGMPCPYRRWEGVWYQIHIDTEMIGCLMASWHGVEA